MGKLGTLIRFLFFNECMAQNYKLICLNAQKSVFFENYYQIHILMAINFIKFINYSHNYKKNGTHFYEFHLINTFKIICL